MVLFQNQRKGFNSYICHLDGYQHSNRFLFWLQSRMVQIDIKYCNKKWAGALASSGHGRRFMTDRSWVQMPHIITDILCGYLIDLIFGQPSLKANQFGFYWRQDDWKNLVNCHFHCRLTECKMTKFMFCLLTKKSSQLGSQTFFKTIKGL